MGAAASTTGQSIDSIQDNLPFPKLGVKLSFIGNFYDICGGKTNLDGLTTTDVCNNFIKPLTDKHQSSFCEMLDQQKHPAVGIATVFISHAWKYLFADVISALEHHFRDQLDTVIWFDLFSNNQHKACSLEFDWWCNTFKTAIEQFGHTVMVLAPWQNPIPFTRGWCIFEVYCSAVTNSKFEVAMSERHQELFFEDMSSNADREIKRMLGTVNAEVSECFKNEDRDMIFQAIRESIGFNRINGMVFEQMRDWMVKITKTTLAKQVDKNRMLSFKLILGDIFANQGKFDEADSQYLESLELSKLLYGEDSLESLSVIHRIISNHRLNLERNHRRPTNSLCIMADTCYQNRVVKLGENHPDTLSSFHELLKLRQNDEGMLDDVEKTSRLFETCYKARYRVLGEKHPDTLTSLLDLADIFSYSRSIESYGEFEKVKRLFKDCYNARKETLGTYHPDTLTAMRRLAEVSRDYTLLKTVLQHMKSILGTSHPDTLLAIDGVADSYIDESRFDLANALYSNFFESASTVLGEGPVVSKWINNMAVLAGDTSKNLICKHSGEWCFHWDDCRCGISLCRDSYVWSCCNQRDRNSLCTRKIHVIFGPNLTLNWRTQFFGLTIQMNNDPAELKPASEVLSNKRYIGIYFGAQWCKKCMEFIPNLTNAYNYFKKSDENALEIIFVSSDVDAKTFADYFGTHPWVSLPFDATSIKNDLLKRFRIEGYPALIIINGETGNVIDAKGWRTVGTVADRNGDFSEILAAWSE